MKNGNRQVITNKVIIHDIRSCSKLENLYLQLIILLLRLEFMPFHC